MLWTQVDMITRSQARARRLDSSHSRRISCAKMADKNGYHEVVYGSELRLEEPTDRDTEPTNTAMTEGNGMVHINAKEVMDLSERVP